MSEKPVSLEDLAREFENASHSIFAPSSSSMWLTCAGSLIPNILAEDDAGAEAAEGTIAHMVADDWLRLGEEAAYKHLGNIYVHEGHEIEIDENMMSFLRDYVNWCNDTPGDHYYETRVDLTAIMPIPKQGGTADFYALAPKKAIVKDLKYGKGVKVDAAYIDYDDMRCVIDGQINGNPQALLYACGVFLEWDWAYDFEEIEVHICQPRLGHFDVWKTTRQQLLDFMEWVKVRAAEAWKARAPRTPSPKACQWCRVKADCPALLAWTTEALNDVFTDLDASTGTYEETALRDMTEIVSDELFVDLLEINADPLTLPVAVLAKVLPYRGIVEKWFAAIEERLISEILDKETHVPGYKIVEGRTNRIFPDEAKVDRAMRRKGLKKEDMYVTKMLSPAQLEQKLHEVAKISLKEAKTILEPLTAQPPGSKTLAPANDRRAALPPAGDVFTDLDAVDAELDDL